MHEKNEQHCAHAPLHARTLLAFAFLLALSFSSTAATFIYYEHAATPSQYFNASAPFGTAQSISASLPGGTERPVINFSKDAAESGSGIELPAQTVTFYGWFNTTGSGSRYANWELGTYNTTSGAFAQICHTPTGTGGALVAPAGSRISSTCTLASAYRVSPGLKLMVRIAAYSTSGGTRTVWHSWDTTARNSSFMLNANSIGNPSMSLGKTAPATHNVSNPLTFTINLEALNGTSSGAPAAWGPFTYIRNSTTAESAPQVTMTPNGTISIVFQHWTNPSTPPTSIYDGDYWDIYSISSPDGGKTWSNASAITSNSVADIQPNHKMAANGTFVVVFQEMVSGQYELFTATSANGINWSTPRQITNNTYAEDDPTIEQDANGMFYIAYDAIIPPATTLEIYILNSSNLINWSAPVQITNNSINDWDPDILIRNGVAYLAWAPALSATNQEIYYSKATNPLNATQWSANAVRITSNSYHDFEPSIYIDRFNQIFISYDTWPDGEALDPDRTSTEIMIANSTLANDAVWDIEQITNNSVQDTYSGLVQASSVLYMLFYSHYNGSALQLVMQSRQPADFDPRNVVVWDVIPANTTLVPGSITRGGTVSNRTITWNLGNYYTGQLDSLYFTVMVNASVPSGTIINNTAFMNYSNSVGTVVETLNATSSTLISQALPVLFTDKADYVNCGRVYYKITVTDLNDVPADASLTVRMLNASGALQDEISASTGNGGVGVYKGFYDLFQTASLGKWILQASTDSGSTGYTNFYAGSGGTDLWKIAMQLEPDSVKYNAGTNLTINFRIENMLGYGVAGLNNPFFTTFSIDNGPNIASNASDLGDGNYAYSLAVSGAGSHFAMVKTNNSGGTLAYSSISWSVR